MKAYLFSIGESTTGLSLWSLQRLGFDVILFQDPKTTLSQKYEQFLDMAYRTKDEWVIRTDADIVHLKNFKNAVEGALKKLEGLEKKRWFAFNCFCFLKMDLIRGTPMLMHREIIEAGQKYKSNFFRKYSRPETEFWRQPEIVDKTFVFSDLVGLHGYKQREEDIARVYQQKMDRSQLHQWDLELISRLEELK